MSSTLSTPQNNGLSTEGTLKDGSFSITIPKPDPVNLDDLDWDLKGYRFRHWKDVKAEPGNMKAYWLSLDLDDSSLSELFRAEASYRKNGSKETGGSRRYSQPHVVRILRLVRLIPVLKIRVLQPGDRRFPDC
jgi:hypothetical protein